MKQLREKVKSRRGATILLALPFFLLCMMVAASVLMAAVSNAGKLRSNYDEQQKYLALSSALRLVVGQIEAAEYTGDYEAVRWHDEIKDGEGMVIEILHYYRVVQKQGRFTCGALSGELPAEGETGVLSFLRELDGVYAKEFAGSGYEGLAGDRSAVLPAGRRTLTLALESGDEAVSAKFPPVQILVDLDESLRIHLTATLRDSGGRTYRMEAELTAKGELAVEFVPGPHELPGVPVGAADSTTSRRSYVEGAYPGRAVGPDITWQLAWMDRKEGGE